MNAILLPVDLAETPSGASALTVALDLARHRKAPLHVVTVLPDFGLPIVGTHFRTDYEKQALDQVGAALADWVNAHVPDDIEVHPHVLHGSIYDEILRAADALKVDLIVIGSNRPALKDYLLGPNAARVVRHARQSVYVVRD